jgi:hypothetical protein
LKSKPHNKKASGNHGRRGEEEERRRRGRGRIMKLTILIMT